MQSSGPGSSGAHARERASCPVPSPSLLQGVAGVRGDLDHFGAFGFLQTLLTVLRDSGRFTGLFLLMTGTPAFFDGTQGVQRLASLAQRLTVDFTTDPRFDNPRATQLRLTGFDLDGLGELGRKVRDLYAGGPAVPDRIRAVVDDAYVDTLAAAVTGHSWAARWGSRPGCS
jgi:hypothetical protein